MKPKTKIILATIALFIVFAMPAQADLVNCKNNCTLHDLVLTVITIINYLLAWAWLVTVLFIVWAGWGMFNSGGNEEEVTKSKAGLTNAIIGFFIVMASFVLINWVFAVVTGDIHSSTPKDTFKNLLQILSTLPK